MSDNISFWSILGIISDIAKSLNDAARDGKITIAEALNIVAGICSNLGINFDTEGLDIDEIKNQIEEFVKDKIKK